MLINNVELEDFDLLDADIAERYERAIHNLEEKEESDNEGLSLADIIRKECTKIFDFLNDVFGEGTDKKVFGNKANYRDCEKAFKQVIDYTAEQKKELDKITSKYSPARIKR